MEKKEKKNTTSLPEGIKMQDLQDNWNTCRTEYAAAYRRMKVLDTVDTGRIWELINSKFPEYQINPDTNYVSFVKDNIVASVYTVGKSASLLARRAEDVEMVDGLNKALETIWGVLDVPSYQLQAGERAALLNIGITQVGWNSEIVDGTTDNWYKGDVVIKNIDPLCFYRDPYADNLDDAAYCIYHDRYHIDTLRSNPIYYDVLKDFNPEGIEYDEGYVRDTGKNPNADAKYVRLIIHWVKKAGPSGPIFHEIHTIDNKKVVYVKENILPSMFPFAELYGSIPVKDPIGVSEPLKILSSSIVVNLLDGIIVTHAYKAQRPPRLISDRSGLNLRAFAMHGNDPDKTFPVRGNASDAVQYVQFPPLPQGLDQVAMRLCQSIERMSGIDAKYTGKDTGSILTTGGIDSMLAQATMRDATRIRLYEEYTKRLTKLIIQHLIVFGDKRQYVYKAPNTTQYMKVEMDLPKINNDILFNYSIDISSEIPKNKAKLAASADAMLEKSMQYQSNPEIITIEEWLSFQDYPQKDLILSRLKAQRQANMTEQVTQVLAMFSNLVGQGMDPNQAIDVVVQQMSQQLSGEAGAEGSQMPAAPGAPGTAPQGPATPPKGPIGMPGMPGM